MRRRKHQENFESRILGSLAAGLISLIKLPFGKKGSPVDRVKAQSAWQEVERMSKGSIEELKIALVQADNVVDSVLRLKVSGETMGDRLKAAQDKFSYETYQNLWEAHKLRNRIAHEAHFAADQEQLRIAIGRFRKSLQEIGIL